MIEIGPQGQPVVRCQAGAPAARLSAQELLQLELTALAEADTRRAGLPVCHPLIACSGFRPASLDQDFRNFATHGLALNLLLVN